MEKDENPYEILGIPESSEEKDVKKAYRKLAMKFHPDKQNADEEKEGASHMFAKIADAYDTLTDPVKRYDWRQKNEGSSRRGGSSSSTATTTTTTASSSRSSTGAYSTTSASGSGSTPARHSAGAAPFHHGRNSVGGTTVRRTQPPPPPGGAAGMAANNNKVALHRPTARHSMSPQMAAPTPKSRPGLQTVRRNSLGHQQGRQYVPPPARPPAKRSSVVSASSASRNGNHNHNNATRTSTYQSRAPAPGRRKKGKDPFLIFEQVMTEEYGKDYKDKITAGWTGNDDNSEELSAATESKRSSSSFFSAVKKTNDDKKKNVPSYKDAFKEIDLDGDKEISRRELRGFVESNESLHVHLKKSLNLTQQQSVDISTDVAFSLAKWDGKDEDAAMASYFITQKNRKKGKAMNITKDEFKSFYKAYVQSQKGSYDFFLRTMFAAYDLNGDGKLQRQEFENFLTIFYHANYHGKMQMPQKAELVRVFQSRLDANKDGLMSFSEIRDLLMVAATVTDKTTKG